MKKLLPLLLTVTLILPSLPPGTLEVSAAPPLPPPTVTLEDTGITLLSEANYRTQVSLPGPHDLERLRQLGVTILSADDDTALVLASREQLEKLAQLRFQPRHTNRLDSLLAGARGRLAVASLSMVDLVALESVDSDRDGLDDDEEGYWCTDPLNTDSDHDRASDGLEVEQLRAGNYTWGTPFFGWPMDPLNADCMDSDHDSVPDEVETFVFGLNSNRESTDRDKFDDGQELFGVTHCPGSGGYCGWGALPRDQDWGVIFAEMPSWVNAPGNSPFVAAYPIPEVEVVEGSWNVERVVVITTEKGEMTQHTNTYETSEMKGTSSSVADTVTWNDWQETSLATPVETSGMVHLDYEFPPYDPGRANDIETEINSLHQSATIWDAFGVALPPLSLLGIAYQELGYVQETYLSSWERDAANKCDPNAPYWAPKCFR